jgi:hypothetical protein
MVTGDWRVIQRAMDANVAKGAGGTMNQGNAGNAWNARGYSRDGLNERITNHARQNVATTRVALTISQ